MNLARIAFAVTFAVLTCSVSSIQAQELRPFSPQDKARVEELLKAFDPNSYDFHYQHVDASGKVQSTHAGLANLSQSNTVRAEGATAANINALVINIFKQAGTVNTINIFKDASRCCNMIDRLKDPSQKIKAQELNTILKQYLAPAPAVAARPVAAPLAGMKPLSLQDKAKVEELLKSFDPNSYSFHYQHLDASGKAQAAHAGLADLRQSNTARSGAPAAVSGIDGLLSARQANISGNLILFKQSITDGNLRVKAEQLNAILQKYMQ